MMNVREDRRHAAIYRIRVQGLISDGWLDWLGRLESESETGPGGVPVTTLTGAIVDQAALRGILTKIWDLNLTLISLVRIEPQHVGGGTKMKGDENV